MAQERPPLNLGPVVVDVTPIRCPEPDARVKAEFSGPAVGRRPAVRTCPVDGKLAVCKDDTRAWINGLEERLEAKHAAGRVLINDNAACRGVKTAPPKTS